MVTKEDLRRAAKAANYAVDRAVAKYRSGFVEDEEEITGVLIGQLDARLNKELGSLTWTTTILRHRRGIAAEEKRIGADMIFHVKMRSENLNYSKGALIQAKKSEPGSIPSTKQRNELRDQCDKMLATSASSYVFNYSKLGLRCESAIVAKGL